jgi:transglutaminase-like putative cysteine protease
LAFFGTVAHAQSDPGLYLYEIELVGGEGTTLSGSSLVVDLVAQDPERLAQALGSTTVELQSISDRGLRVTLGGNDHFKGKPDARLASSSWVVDFDERSVQSLLQTLWDTSTAGEEGLPREITRFTNQKISDKHYRTGFDIASQVANSLQGDCTEHAVLNAALVRASGYPARVVLGVLILVSEQGAVAAGHAWNEIYYQDSWHIHDATLPLENTDVQRVFYLPLNPFDDEGPGYVMEMMGFALLRPHKIYVVE